MFSSDGPFNQDATYATDCGANITSPCVPSFAFMTISATVPSDAGFTETLNIILK